MHQPWPRFPFALLVILAFVLSPLPTTHAQRYPAYARVGQVRTKLVIDCARTLQLPKGRAYARQHGLCTTQRTGAFRGRIAPHGTVAGDCGFATLELYNGRRPGEALLHQSLQSTIGWMTYIHTTVGYSGPAQSGLVDRVVPLYASGYWEADDFRTTGSGGVFANMTHAWVQIATGVVCVGMNPTDIEYIR